MPFFLGKSSSQRNGNSHSSNRSLGGLGRMPSTSAAPATRRLGSTARLATGGGGGGYVGTGSAQSQFQIRRPAISQQPRHQLQQKQQQQPLVDLVDTTQFDVNSVMSDIAMLTQAQEEEDQKCARELQNLQKQKQILTEKESQVAKYKHSNADQRTQTRLHRNLLSECQRQLAKTTNEKEGSHDEIKAFNAALKKALRATRINGEYRRKIQATITFVTASQVDRVAQLRNQALKIPARLEKQRDHVKQQLEQLRSDVVTAAKESSEYSEQVAKARGDMSALEEELASAQDTEATTKTHAQGLENEISTNLKNHDTVMESISLKIQQAVDATKAGQERGKEMQSAVDKAKDQVSVLRDRLKELQSNNPSVEVVAEQEAESLAQAHKDKENLEASIESLNLSQTDLQKQEETFRNKIEDTTKATQAVLQTQLQRRQGMEKVVLEIEVANKELQELEKAYSDLTDNRVRSRKQSDTDTTALQTAIDAQLKEIATLKDLVLAKQASLNQFKEEWPIEKAVAETELGDLKREAATAQEVLKSIKAEVEVARAAEKHNPEKLRKIEETRVAKEMVAVLLTEHPQLELVKYEFDPDLHFDSQAVIALADLHEHCRKSAIAIQENFDSAVVSEKAKKAARELKRQEDDARIEKTERDNEKKKRIKEERAAKQKRVQEEEREAEEQRLEAERVAAKKRLDDKKQAAKKKRIEEKERATAEKERIEEEERLEKEERDRKKAASRQEKENQESEDMAMTQYDTTDYLSSTQTGYDQTQTPEEKMRKSSLFSQSTNKSVHWKEESDDTSITEPEAESQTTYSQALEQSNQNSKKKVRQTYQSKWPTNRQPAKKNESNSRTDRRGSRDSGRGRSKSPKLTSKETKRRLTTDFDDHDNGGGILGGDYLSEIKSSSKSTVKKKTDRAPERTGESNKSKGDGTRASGSGGIRKRTTEKGSGNSKSKGDDARVSVLDGGRERETEKSNGGSGKKRNALASATKTQPHSKAQPSKKRKMSLSGMSSGTSKNSSQLSAKRDSSKNPHRRSSNAKGSGIGRTPLTSNSQYSNSSKKKLHSSGQTKKQPHGKPSVGKPKKKKSMMGAGRKSSMARDVEFKF